MKPPDKVRVGPHTYRVTTDSTDLNAACAAQGSIPGELLGQCDRKRLRIVLDPDQAPSSLRVTVLHEVLHALTDVTGTVEDLGDEAEERTVNRLAPALLDTLRRNPKLVSYLTT